MRARLLKRLSRGANARRIFVESQLAKDLSYQIRAMRDREDWNQAELARRCGTSQNGISRQENPAYGKPSLTSLKKIAAAFDTALVVRFVPFGELVDWVAGIPRTVKGLSETESLLPPNFTQEQEAERSLAAHSSAAAFEDSTWFYRPPKWAMTPAVTMIRRDEVPPPEVTQISSHEHDARTQFRGRTQESINCPPSTGTEAPLKFGDSYGR